ncbi:DUF2249 domain-containing protein [Castellaniella hirudinis]|uniref:DUF2249 domain-containing protein n=1 Tax=Castellaniella hirudinis TaxID=1144617 RepID=UPI0039C325E6
MSHPDITLDVRSLPPPEPLELCLEALADLAPGQRLHLLIDREPYPLYTLLDRDGFQHECLFKETHFQVSIWID